MLAAPRTSEVPRENLLEIPELPPPDRKLCESLFRQMHELSEKDYNGDGSWGKGCADEGIFDRVETPCIRPLMRHSLGRANGYLAASGLLGDLKDLMLQRARSACEYLLSEQRPDGYFPYYIDDSGWPKRDHCGIMLVSGVCIDSLLDGYLAFGEPRFLRAAYRGCEWAMRFPVYYNTNYNSFLAWPLARMSEILAKAPADHQPEHMCVSAAFPPGTRRPGEDPVADCLERSIYFTKEGVFAGQQPNGGWPGHNSWIWYHGIILLGLNSLLKVLPQDHEIFEQTRQAAIAATNYAISNISPDGDLMANFETDSPGAPWWCLSAFSFMQPGIYGNTEEIGRLKNIAARAVIRYAEKNPGMTVNQETGAKGYICPVLVDALGKVLKYIDTGT